jgi:hypothetical protein
MALHKITYSKYECLNCEKKFNGPGKGYICPEGTNQDSNHVVEAKKYFSASAGLLLQWKDDRRVPDNSGNIVYVPGKSAQFIQGMFSTTDPEEQDYLNTYPGCITFEQWEEVFIPEKLRNEKRDREAKSNKTVITQQNAELIKLRKQLGLDPETGEKIEKSA